jgi:Methyltransferase domain
MVSSKELDDYASRGRKSIGGWLARLDAEMMTSVLIAQNDQGLSGSVAEIGVHHGKVFILLCLGLKDDEKAYCIDIFDDQHLNKDNSGRGDRAILEKNLAKFSVRSERVIIDGRSSELVKADDILAQVGPVRLFSIDGGHWLDIVVNDLRVAEAALAPHGVIVLDDFHRHDWPDVSAGYFKWFSERKRPIVPFAIGLNKLYLCQSEFTDFYQKALLKGPVMRYLRARTCEFQGVTVPVYESRLLPEDSFRDRCKAYLRIVHPEKVASAKRLLGLFR